MKLITATTFATLLCSAVVDAEQGQPRPDPKPSPDVLQVTPQLYQYTTDLLFGQVWKRQELAPRDRSLITLAALVASGQSAQLTGHIKLGLDNGLKPDEISALITHLAFYAGWPNAMSAAGVAKQVFSERHIAAAQIAPPPAAPLTLDPASEEKRRAAVAAGVGDVAPELARYTNEVLFGDLWRQPSLSARDRSLVTVAALIAQGQAAQLPFHLNRAMDNGLTQAQAAEVVTHLAFYVGWPKAMSAVPVLKDVFAGRVKPAESSTPLSSQDHPMTQASQTIVRSGTKPSIKGPEAWFTGAVRIDSPFQAAEPARLGGAIVTFEPGARTAWHTHPLGQTLVVLSGVGWTQCEGGPRTEIRAGDVVSCACGKRHWHGASATTAMSHLAMTEMLDGKNVEWLEKVTDEQYLAGPLVTE